MIQPDIRQEAPSSPDPVTQDFIFGTLATDDLRLDALRAAGRGLTHFDRAVPRDPRPDEPITLTVSAGTEVDPSMVTLIYTIDRSEPGDGSPTLGFEPGPTVWDTLLWGYRREWRVALPPQTSGTTIRYRIAATGNDGTTTWADAEPETGRPRTFALPVDAERVPEWVRDAIIYHVFVDRFSPGDGKPWNAASTYNDFWGGTIRGITERLPYLVELGVTCLWLSPVFPSPSHHGYDATDYVMVEPRLGTDADLAELFTAAHDRGIRVLLDFVANHVSDEHPAFRLALTDATAPERQWFTIDPATGAYQSFFGVPTMPRIDTDYPAARAYLVDAATRWLARGADGFRLDYANGPSHDFWAAFRAATRAVKPDSVTVGEVVETAELQRSYAGRLDGTLDFLLHQQLRAFFAFETIGAAAFEAFLGRHLAFFGGDFVLPSFLDNHDMNRFLWVVGGDTRRLRLAALCQFTLPHPPVIYYGTEVGLSQERDLQYPDGSRRLEESRAPMPWDERQDADLLAYYRRLIALRRGHPGLWAGRRRTIGLEDAGLLAVEIRNGDLQAVVALNRTLAAARVRIPGGLALTIETDPSAALDGRDLVLPPLAGAVLIG